MFWKKKTDTVSEAEVPQEDSVDKIVAHESPDQEAPMKPGLAARIKSLLAALVKRFKKPPAFSAAEDQAPDASERSEPTPKNTSSQKPINLKKRLIIGGAIGLLILLLSGIGFAVWKILLSTPKQDIDTPATAETSHPVQPVPHTAIPRAEIDALRKKNIELQAEIEALKKEQQPQQSSTESTAQQTSDNISSSSISGEITVDNKDPKATAMSLKEAIEAMNAGSGDYDKKKSNEPHQPKP